MSKMEKNENFTTKLELLAEKEFKIKYSKGHFKASEKEVWIKGFIDGIDVYFHCSYEERLAILIEQKEEIDFFRRISLTNEYTWQQWNERSIEIQKEIDFVKSFL
jgi:hypothetical protein